MDRYGRYQASHPKFGNWSLVPVHFGRCFCIVDVDFLPVSMRETSVEMALVATAKEFRERPPENIDAIMPQGDEGIAPPASHDRQNHRVRMTSDAFGLLNHNGQAATNGSNRAACFR